MTLDRRTQALLDLVDVDQRTQCGAILTAAHSAAAELHAQARAAARTRIREAFADERRRAHERVASATARLQTRRRLHAQQRAATQLDLGWQRLPLALRERWREADGRRQWVDAVLATALAVLPHRQWQITHAPDWPEAEQRAVVARLLPKLDAPPTCVADADIAAGLKIDAGGNVVDATLAGLLGDRADVGSRLLRHLEEAP